MQILQTTEHQIETEKYSVLSKKNYLRFLNLIIESLKIHTKMHSKPNRKYQPKSNLKKHYISKCKYYITNIYSLLKRTLTLDD